MDTYPKAIMDIQCQRWNINQIILKQIVAKSLASSYPQGGSTAPNMDGYIQPHRYTPTSFYQKQTLGIAISYTIQSI